MESPPAASTSAALTYVANRFVMDDILWVDERSAGILVAVDRRSGFKFHPPAIIHVSCFLRDVERLPMERNHHLAASDRVHVVNGNRSLYHFNHTLGTVAVVAVT